MSVLIKGMEMPKHCGYCRFRYDGICHALQKTQYAVTDCPLIDLPDHGDLIDQRELMREFARFVRRSNNSDFAPTPNWNDAVSLVGSAPVVIPAERSKE